MKRASSRNHLLSSLDAADLALLEPSLTLVDLHRGHELVVPQTKIMHSWFPLSGMVSVVATTPSGQQAEVAIVGREGLIAVSTIHGIDWGTAHIFAQLPGEALRIPATALRAAMAASPTLSAMLHAYVFSFAEQVASAAFAYAMLTIEQRLARWLLMSLDRLDTSDVALTHESFALMLGVRRAGVTVAIQALEAKGAVARRRATVQVTDRTILASIAGDAYGNAELAYARALGFTLIDGPLAGGLGANGAHAPA